MSLRIITEGLESVARNFNLAAGQHPSDIHIIRGVSRKGLTSTMLAAAYIHSSVARSFIHCLPATAW
jgi:hypothetical protein